MRLAVLSDMHSNAVAFEAVVADLRRQTPDAVVCLGDVVMRGPQPKECVDLLRSLGPLVTVRGNYDDRISRWFPEPGWQPRNAKDERLLRDVAFTRAALTEADRAWFDTLPVAFADFGVEMYHAGPLSLGYETWPWAPVEELQRMRRDQSSRMVLFGHMHHAFVRQAGGFTIVNVGSVGLPFDRDPRASYAILDLGPQDTAVQLRRVTYDVEAAVAVAARVGMPDLEFFTYAVRHGAYPYE